MPDRPSSSSSPQSKAATRYHPRTASPTPSQASSLRSPPPSSALSQVQRSPRPSTDATEGLKDYTYLLQPTTFHPLPTSGIPSAFLKSAHQPSSNTPIESLLRHGHFRHAATAAATQLSTSTKPSDHARIFELWYARLACLCLCGHTALAAGEAKVLGDLGSEFYHDSQGRHVVPWELRVLAVRLQALGFGEWRRGVMGYYELAREARQEVADARKAERVGEARRWEERLSELGVRVADAVIEMADLEGAGRHLASLRRSRDGDSTGDVEKEEEREEAKRRLAMYEALVWLRVGDLASAERCLDDLGSTGRSTGTLEALINTANGDFEAATSAWQALRDQHPEDAIVGQNLAVCLLYTGQMDQARELLIELHGTEQSAPFQALTFNLATLYELCSEKSKDSKLAMAIRDAERAPTAVGWEKATVDYKL